MTTLSRVRLPFLDVTLPDESLFCKLIACPECGSEYCLSGIRTGPATLLYTSNYYRVVCLTCWHKGCKGTTEQKAIDNWNQQVAAGRLKELRLKAGLSQAKLSELAGIGYTAISNIERGIRVPSENVRTRLAAVLGVREDEI